MLFVLNRSVRQMAQEQFFLMATRCCMGHRPLLFFITLLFTVLGVSGNVANIAFVSDMLVVDYLLDLNLKLCAAVCRVQQRSEPDMLGTTSLCSDIC